MHAPRPPTAQATDADVGWHHPACRGKDVTAWTADKFWVLYNEVVSPEMHAYFKMLDEVADHPDLTLEHARSRLVTCAWQDEQLYAEMLAAGAIQEAAARHSPPEEDAGQAAAADHTPVASTWQADWSWGLLSVGDC